MRGCRSGTTVGQGRCACISQGQARRQFYSGVHLQHGGEAGRGDTLHAEAATQPVGRRGCVRQACMYRCQARGSTGRKTGRLSPGRPQGRATKSIDRPSKFGPMVFGQGLIDQLGHMSWGLAHADGGRAVSLQNSTSKPGRAPCPWPPGTGCKLHRETRGMGARRRVPWPWAAAWAACAALDSALSR